MKASRFRWAACSALLAAIACGQSDRENRLAAALEDVRPYASRFGSFEAWAGRACSVADPTASDRTLSETLFATVRGDRELLAAWIRLGPKSQRVMSLPSAVPLPDARLWTRVRDPALGWISVARFQRCPLDMTTAKAKEVTHPCVIIARAGESLSGQQPQVTMAFVEPAAE